MLALAAYRASHCEGCGRPLDESTDIESDQGYRVVEARCHGCVALAHAAAKHAKFDAPQAFRYRVEPKQRR